MLATVAPHFGLGAFVDDDRRTLGVRRRHTWLRPIQHAQSSAPP
jgi:hypothetical protein